VQAMVLCNAIEESGDEIGVFHFQVVYSEIEWPMILAGGEIVRFISSH
jgi:hypothetical protein